MGLGVSVKLAVWPNAGTSVVLGSEDGDADDGVITGGNVGAFSGNDTGADEGGKVGVDTDDFGAVSAEDVGADIAAFAGEETC